MVQSAGKRQERRPTRASFIEKLRDWEDHAAWRRFLADYGLLIHRAAVRAGLEAHEADEVVQETAVSVARKMPEFVYDPSRCSFEGWVRRIARLRILDQIRRRPVEQAGVALDVDANSGTGGTDVIAKIPAEPDAAGGEAAFEENWQRSLLEAALDRLRQKVSPEHFQIFQMNVVNGISGSEVAAILDVSLAQVYVVRHRLMHRLKREVTVVQERLSRKSGS